MLMSDWNLWFNSNAEQDHPIKIAIIIICWRDSLSLFLFFGHQSAIPNAHFEKCHQVLLLRIKNYFRWPVEQVELGRSNFFVVSFSFTFQMTRICADLITWNLLFSFKIFTYLFGCTRSWLWHTGSLISVVAGGIFSCGMHDLVP